MDKEIRSSVRYAKTAREIWVDLEERFGKVNAPRAYELRSVIALLKQEKLSVSSYYTKLKSLWEEMQSISTWPKCTCNGCTCNVQKQLVEMRERDQLYDFLMGLDDSFGTVKTQILSTKPTPSLGSAYHLVAEDEQQKQISSLSKQTTEAAAFQIKVLAITRMREIEESKEKRDQSVACAKR
ncbi:UNVERIFIED_CONTAM: hypothetical protein Sradi_2327000 [Sesamum radiatum]|uniref:Retrotransposon gag domain-containing protein n=1 Tax=Sesamum radiatum TaxID=300843 RepID=A0AAW2T5K7_SESRA